MEILTASLSARGELERIRAMRKGNQKRLGTDLYALVEKAQLSERDRQVAIDAIEAAEKVTNAVLWVKEKVASMGNWFLKPSVKH